MPVFLRLSQPSLTRLVLALLLPFIAAGVQWELWDYFQPLIWFLFYPTVFFSPLIGGLWGGIGATAISAVLVWYIFIPPQLSFVIEDSKTILSLILFAIMGIVFSFFYERLRYIVCASSASESDEKFRHLFNVSPVAMGLRTRDGILIDYNEKFAQTFGYSRDEIRTIEDWWRCIYPNEEYRSKLSKSWMDAKRHSEATGERIAPKECLITCKNGDILVMMASGTFLGDNILSTFVDITETHRAMNELAAAKERAETACRAKSVFLANMSHELRTPLNAIIGFSDLLLIEEIQAERREQLEIVSKAGKNLLKLVQDLLEFSKLEARKLKLETTSFNLADELNDIIKLFRTQIDKTNLTFTTSITPELSCQVRGDISALRQVIMNLIGNALKFTPKGGIEISATIDSIMSENRQIVILFHVTDTGIGIKPENQHRIFALFEQEDISTTRRFGGSGLGLAISEQLVTLMGGRIWLESVPNVGSRFSFTATFDLAVPEQPAVAVSQVALPAGAGANLLVIENDVFSRKLLLSLLEPHDYQVRCAEDGAHALAMLKENRFEAVLMDLHLPEINGIELTRRIRSGSVDGCDPAMPVIAVSAYVKGKGGRWLSENGITDFVGKPIDAIQLLTTVNRSLNPEAAI